MSGDVRPPIPQFHCECCNLPLVFARNSIGGYLCLRCMDHIGLGGPPSTARAAADIAEMAADHELMAAVWWALVDVGARGPLADALREALADGPTDL